MPLTRLDNLYSSKTGKYLYVSPDDFNATDELDNRGNSPLRPFKSIQRAFLEVSRYSYLPGKDNDRFDQFSIMLMPGNHYIDNRPGLVETANPESRYFDSGNLIEANKQLIVDRSAAEIFVQHPDFFHPGDNQTDDGSRFADAYRLVQLNRKEIVDKSAAHLAVEFPDFFYPGGNGTTEAEYRFKDGYRLIQQNKREIVDRAAAEIAVAHPDFFFPGDPADDPVYRFKDAYRLIQQNRTEIIDSAWTAMQAGANAADPADEAKCKRDIGLLVDYVGIDLVKGGNEYTRKFTLKYFQGGVFSYIISEVLSTNDAYNAARDLMIQAMKNQLTITDATITIDPNSCANVESAINVLVQIVTDAFTAADTAGIPAETLGSDLTNEAKCKRDLGIFVDYLGLDLVSGGNEYTRRFTGTYFDNTGSPIANGLLGEEAQSITAFNKARDLMQSAVNNILLVQDATITVDGGGCANVQSAIATLTQIFTTVINDGNLSQLPVENLGNFASANEVECKRDLGEYIDAISLDVALAGGNRYTRKYLKTYFNEAGNAFISGSLENEQTESIVAFNKARDLMIDAFRNELFSKDSTITADPNGTPLCADVASMVGTLAAIVETVLTDGNLTQLPAEVVTDHETPGETKCKRDIGFIVEGVLADIRNGGNSNTISVAKSYFDREGSPLANGIVGEEVESITAYNKARDMMKLAVTNSLYDKDLTISPGPAIAGANTPDIEYDESGNPGACIDVQTNIQTLVTILTDVISAGSLSVLSSVQVTGVVPIFDYNRALQEWQDDSIIDLGNPDNVFYKFNSTEGGCIVPRGCSLIGYDLRRTIIRPLYVPDPVDGDQERTGIFKLTGGCYLWQFTIKDGDLSENSPLYDQADKVGKVYYKKNSTDLKIPEYSHHKICIMTYAGNDELDRYYEKVGRAFAQFQPTIDDGELEALVQETRIVGPLSDTRTVEQIQVVDIPGTSQSRLTVTTKIEHGYFKGQYIAVINSGLSDEVNGTFKVDAIDDNNPKVFTYIIPITAAGLGLVSGTTYSTANGLGTSAVIQAEIDSVESASPYVFNCSIRSTWGQCGMWADGSKATGFKSMVVAQYTGVSLQKDDRAFIRYDRFTNTWNQASLTDAFATIPYHTKGDAYWKDEWRNFHIRASDDSFIQCVSVFAVGFHDHFLMESGGDMSITNSNSNFGNTSLHSIGFKGFAFNQDKGGYIDAIIPPKVVNTNVEAIKKNAYYTLDIEASNDVSNNTKLYLAGDTNKDPASRPAASIDGYRIGAKQDDRLYVKLPSGGVGGKQTYHGTLEPSGIKSVTASLDTLTPANLNVLFDLDGDGNDDFNKAYDAANLIEKNRSYLAEETYGYITAQYPALLTNTSLTITKCERDIGFIVDAVVKDLRVGGNINTVYASESYISSGNVSYVDTELTETLIAYDYLKRLIFGVIRNGTLLIKNCTTSTSSPNIVVGDTSGLTTGMQVSEYSENDFVNGFLTQGSSRLGTNLLGSGPLVITQIINATTIEVADPATGQVYQPQLDSSTAWLYFENVNQYSSSPRIVDLTITQDDTYPECTNIVSAIEGYFDVVNLVLNGNGNQVTRVEAIIESSSLIGRATVFVIDTGNGDTDPHGFQTGTPVRLIPRATNPAVDKRLVRLPRGFETNRPYYVIAPGRDTYPNSFNNTSEFDNTAGTKLMLAATKENAAAGIYIYSSETESMSPDVELLVQQQILDENYDLHRYVCNVSGIYIETDIPHTFDVPVPNVPAQTIFFSTSGDASSQLPTISGAGDVATDVYYFPRFISKTKFSVHTTQADAQAGTNAVIFTANSGSDFIVYGNKKTSPLKYDPVDFQRWYLNVKDESSGGTDPNAILTRFHATDFVDGTGNLFTPDTYYERIEDDRSALDRVYRLRYVLPQYLQTVREPLNGYVIKSRTDDRRRLKAQKFYLEPFSNGAPAVAQFFNPARPTEQLGLSLADLDAASVDITGGFYDPYENPLQIEFESKIATTIQCAKTISVDPQGTGTLVDRLELTVFDHTIINQQLKNEIFTVIEIGPPQGAGIQTSIYNSNSDNYVSWTGYCSGSGYVHAYYQADGTAFVILKNITGKIDYDVYSPTNFVQNNGTFFNLTGQPDAYPTSRSRSDRKNFLYRIEGANVYTAVPGDKITTPGGDTYTVSQLDDVPDIDDTFYIFNIETIQEQIPLQQDGIYYLTCVRGNISPYPLGAGVGENFHYYKFSQPISNLYPLDYKNDPLWFQVSLTTGARDLTILDPPASAAAADNYVHGLVTLNDYKFSETKEAVVDLTRTSPFAAYEFTNTTSNLNSIILDNRIQAQEGNASVGSENRQIPISGDSVYPLERKFYAELRRPSIARSGNHTFEYLGFGPGNYSTGFPLRQEVVLSDKQDFYAQAKREDGGIVFYTGLNSNGDLYIGNRKINAITGEETFLEQAVLEDSGDDDEGIGALVTTFDTAVTFNDKVTIEGDTFLNNPVTINVDPLEGDALRILSLVDTGDDPTQDRSSFRDTRDGDIILTKNQIEAAVYKFNPRGNVNDPGQVYTWRTHYTGGLPSNASPDNTGLLSAGQGGTAFYTLQSITYGSSILPAAGDVLYKGLEVGSSGSMGWVYSNFFTELGDLQIFSITSNNTAELTITWAAGLDNNGLGIRVGENLRISNFSNSFLNGTWAVLAGGFSGTGNTCTIRIFNEIAQNTYAWADEGPGAKMEISKSRWKETGIIGAEALRTRTEVPGDYRLGINTIGRMAKEGVLTASVSAETDPRSNLDVVGNAFISGKNLVSYDAVGAVTANNYLAEPSVGKTYFALTNAFLVGGDSSDPDDFATLRVATSDLAVADQSSTYRVGGRVGINTSIGLDASTELDKNFVVIGDSRFTGNVQIQDDLSVDGGDINSTSETFRFLTDNVDFLIAASDTESFNIGNNTTSDQLINIGNNVSDASSHTLRVGANAGVTTFEVHKRSTNAFVDIASVEDVVGSACSIKIGGAAPNLNSQTLIGTYQTKLNGTLEVGAFAGTSTTRIFTTAATLNIGDGQNTTKVTIGANSSTVDIAALGGRTTIRNSLLVQGSTTSNSTIKLSGGLNAGIIAIDRARFGTSPSEHIVGSLDNPNITFLKYIQLGRQIDTAGVGPWGGDQYLLSGGQIAAIDNITPESSATWVANETYSFITPTGGTGSGALFTVQVLSNGTADISLVSPGSGYSDNDLLTIEASKLGNSGGADLSFRVNGTNDSGNVYLLPITKPSVNDFQIGDLLFIERAVEVTGQDTNISPVGEEYSELLEVAGLTNITDPADPLGFRILVTRAKDGTTARQDHPDNVIISKFDKQLNASFITGFDFDNNGTLDPTSSVTINDTAVLTIVADGTDIVTINWNNETNTSVGADYGEFITIAGSNIVGLNGTWPIQGGISGPASSLEIKTSQYVSTGTYVWSDQAAAAEVKINSGAGLLADSASVRIGVAEFGGVLTTSDYLLLSDSEIVKVDALVSTDIQSLVVTDGGDPEVEVFKVESTTGNTFVGNTLSVGQGFNKFVVDGGTGDTVTQGKLTTNNDLTVRGSVVELTQFFTLTNGGSSGTAERNTLRVDTATGDLEIYGGDFNIFGPDGTTPRLQFNNSSGDFTTFGSFSALGTGTSVFGGSILAAGDLTVNGGDLTVNSGGNEVFGVDEDGAVTVAGISNYFSQTGGRKWVYSDSFDVDAEANTNYFLNISQNTVVKLPSGALIGDMIRIVDIGGLLTYNLSLVVRAPSTIKVQNASDNTGTTLLTGNTADLNGYDGGELVVQTPNAGFALVFAGTTDPDGNTAVPIGKDGWFLIEV